MEPEIRSIWDIPDDPARTAPPDDFMSHAEWRELMDEFNADLDEEEGYEHCDR